MTILDADKDPEGSGDSPWSSKPPLSILYNPANSSEYIYIQKNGLDQSEASIQVTWPVWTNQRPVLPGEVPGGAGACDPQPAGAEVRVHTHWGRHILVKSRDGQGISELIHWPRKTLTTWYCHLCQWEASIRNIDQLPLPANDAFMPDGAHQQHESQHEPLS